MVVTSKGAKNIFILVEQINLEEIQKQAHGCFGLLGIGNVGITALLSPLTVSTIFHLSNNNGTS